MIEFIKHWIDIILHADRTLKLLVVEYQDWTYLILFVIIFCETGLVITPFLPGDSLLFAAGTIASGLGVLNIYSLAGILLLAAFAGDNSNYFIGRFIGPKVFGMNLRYIRKDYLERTHAFYQKHGGKTVIIARFVPIIRTFAPFVAGVGTMTYRRFILFSIAGSMLWINTFLWVGFLLGTNGFIQTHFTLVTIFIIIISLLPAFGAAAKARLAGRRRISTEAGEK